MLDAARALGSTVVPDGRGGEIDLEGEWVHLPILDAVSDAVGEEIDVDTPAEVLRKIADRHDVALQPSWDAAEIVVELYEQLVEDHLLQPTFVTDYPAAVKPLAKPHRSKPGLVEAWDLIIGGVELAPAYSELNDPVEQRRRLVEQSLQGRRRRPRGDAAGRGLPAGDGVRHAAAGRDGAGHRPADPAAHRGAVAARHHRLPAAQAGRQLTVDVLAALLPPVVVAAAFIAIAIAVKRMMDAEDKDER